MRIAFVEIFSFLFSLCIEVFNFLNHLSDVVLADWLPFAAHVFRTVNYVVVVGVEEIVNVHVSVLGHIDGNLNVTFLKLTCVLGEILVERRCAVPLSVYYEKQTVGLFPLQVVVDEVHAFLCFCFDRELRKSVVVSDNSFYLLVDGSDSLLCCLSKHVEAAHQK